LVRHRFSKRERAELDELDDEPARPPVPDPALLAYRSSPDMGLLARTAQQDVQLSNYAEQIESLESQRRWLLGGLGVSVAAFLLLVIKRRPRTTQGLAPARQQQPGMRA
jgi:hypothetical protein